MNKYLIILIIINLMCLKLFPTEKVINEKVLVFNFINNNIEYSNNNLTDVFIEELNKNHILEIVKNINKLNEKEMLDIGEKSNFDKIIKGKLSFFDNNWYLELTCFSVKTRVVIIRKTISEKSIKNLIFKLKEVTKDFFIEKKESKIEKITVKEDNQRRFRYNTYKYGKVGTGILIGGSTPLTLGIGLLSIMIYATYLYRNNYSLYYGFGLLFIILADFTCYFWTVVCLLAGMIMIPLGIYFLYKYKEWLLYAKIKDNNKVELGLAMKI